MIDNKINTSRFINMKILMINLILNVNLRFLKILLLIIMLLLRLYFTSVIIQNKYVII